MHRFARMLTQKKENCLLYSILAVLFVFLFYICYTAKATFDSGDGIQHYLMARYSWKHPLLLLDLWAKPLFTFISSPFAQFGLIGMNVFQILCAIATSFFCFRITKHLEIKNGLVLPILICFAPIYFPIINTGLTEIFFAFMVVLSIYLMMEKKYFLSAVVVSFLPFARNEGYLFFPLFTIVLLYRKQYLPILLLGTGTLFLSIIGYFVFDNIGWLFTKNPYTGAQDIYGHGELLSFVKQYDQIFGLTMTVFILLGLFQMFLKITTPQKTIAQYSFFPEELFLIYGCAIVYFAAHSIFWWKGMFSSLGMTRMMAAIIPLAALISLRGFNALSAPIRKYFWASLAAAAVYAGWVAWAAFHQWYLPFQLGSEDKVIIAVGKWYKSSGLINKKMYYLHPFLPHALQIDPFDQTKTELLWKLDKEHPENSAEDGEIVIWDSHYGPNEGRMESTIFSENERFILLKKFMPRNEFTVIGGRKFEVCVFQKQNNSGDWKSNSTNVFSSVLYDFETDSAYLNSFSFSSEKSFSGKYSCKLSSTVEYGAGIEEKIESIDRFDSVTSVTVKAQLFSETQLKEIFLVIEIHDKNNKQLSWQGNEIKTSKSDSTVWQPVSSSFSINTEFFRKENSIKCYIWNKSKSNFYMDDLKLIYTRENQNTIIVWD